MAAAGEYGALLDAVRGVRWPARRPVAGGLPGAHHSRMRGIAPEFAEYRPYRQGDDPRRIDWRVLARTDRAMLRLSTDRSILATMIVVDASASMAYPAETHDKWACARRIAVALAAIAHREHDPVGLAVTGVRPRRLPPRSRAGVIGEIARTLDDTRPGRTSPLAAALRSGTGARRAVLITDFLDEEEAVLAIAREHIATGGEMHAVHVIAREELDPPARGMTAVDPENEAIARTLVPATRDAYLLSFAEWRDRLAGIWRAAGAGYTLVVADEQPACAVRRIVTSVSGPAGGR